MPLIESKYKAPVWIGGKHRQTIIPALFRKVTGVEYLRARISTLDGDFLELDWSRINSENLVICSHGLEGSSRQPYIMGMVKEFNARGWDALAWNFRGCGSELNHSARLSHAGSTHDLKAVVNHAIKTKPYKKICLIAFSLGGNLTLKYLGDHKAELPKILKRACVISAPVDLYACAKNLSQGINRIYLNRFLDTLKVKMEKKIKANPGLYSSVNIKNINNFVDWDNQITAPLCGFKDAIHYYSECSSKCSISNIEIPTLVINAKNDPFMHPLCMPYEECKKSSCVYFETPFDGGHQGFIKDKLIGTYWSEERAVEFLEKCL